MSDQFSYFLSLMYIFLLELSGLLTHIFIVVLRYGTYSISQNDINARDVSNAKFRITVNKECKRAIKGSLEQPHGMNFWRP